MKAADSATYKQTYYFTDDFSDSAEDNPSVKGQPSINTTIKENPYRSNVEIEGGELVLQPDLSALFKANGKKHSQGGMDVLLQPNAFVFSDFKDLSIDKDEKEVFELKMGGKAKGKDTPAEVVKQNVDVKHYNTLISNIQDPFKDELARKSSAMMLEKYIGTLGNIAYLQESKKGFPDGLPDFSIGSAPVFNKDTKDAVEESKQYAKYGGKIGENPYMQTGGTNRRPKNPNAVYDPKTGLWYSDPSQIPGGNVWDWTSMNPKTVPPMPGPMNPNNSPVVVAPPPTTQKTTTNGQAPRNVTGQVPVPEWGPWKGDKLSYFKDRFGVTNAADKFDNLKDWDAVTKKLGYTGPKDNLQFQHWLYESSPENKAIIDKWHNQYEDPNITKKNRNRFDSHIGIRWANAINEITTRPQPDGPNNLNIPAWKWSIPEKGPDPNQVSGDPQGFKRANWEFTPWQKISQAYNWGQFANVRRYMPARSHYNATYADPSLLNPEQTIGDVKGQVTQQLNALGTLNPIMRNAQAASAYGAALTQIPAIRTQYDNQNAQITNQFRQYNNQVRNNESLVNMQNDQQYYQQAVEGRKNFDNLRQFAANNAMNNTLRDVETNQKLAYNLLTQNNPAYSFDWRTGDFLRTNKDIRDVASTNNTDVYTDFLNELKNASTPEDLEKLKIKERLLRQTNVLPYLKQQSSKKGGKIKNPYSY